MCAGGSAAACDALCGAGEASQHGQAFAAQAGEDAQQDHIPAQKALHRPAWQCGDGQVSSLAADLWAVPFMLCEYCVHLYIGSGLQVVSRFNRVHIVFNNGTKMRCLFPGFKNLGGNECLFCSRSWKVREFYHNSQQIIYRWGIQKKEMGGQTMNITEKYNIYLILNLSVQTVCVSGCGLRD